MDVPFLHLSRQRTSVVHPTSWGQAVYTQCCLCHLWGKGTVLSRSNQPRQSPNSRSVMATRELRRLTPNEQLLVVVYLHIYLISLYWLEGGLLKGSGQCSAQSESSNLTKDFMIIANHFIIHILVLLNMPNLFIYFSRFMHHFEKDSVFVSPCVTYFVSLSLFLALTICEFMSVNVCVHVCVCVCVYVCVCKRERVRERECHNLLFLISHFLLDCQFVASSDVNTKRIWTVI